MVYPLKNNHIAILVNSLGGELKSLVKRENNTEYLWQGDPTWWGRSAPVLFPIVGRVKNNQVRIDGIIYHMTQHGFARDREFLMLEQSAEELLLCLQSDEATRRYLPWDFRLLIHYHLRKQCVEIRYTVENSGAETLHFSLGTHPGFNIPDGKMEACELIFEKRETAGRRLLKDGLFTGESEPVLQGSNSLKLHRQLFDSDAVILDNLQSNQVTLRTSEPGYQVVVSWQGFPYLGIWSQKGCDRFVCIEPWHGLADQAHGHEDFREKEGIIALPAGQSREFGLSIEV